MENWSRKEPLFIFISLLLGYFASYIPFISDVCSEIEEYLFMTLLFFIFLEIDWAGIKQGFSNKKFLFLDLTINFLWTPLLAFVLGMLLFGNNIYLKIALTLLLVLPCTDWYLIFTEMSNGNVALSASVLPFNLILQLVILPLCLSIFYGYNGILFDAELSSEVVFELLIPLVCAVIVKIFLRKKPEIEHQLHEISDKVEFILISIIAFSIFAAEGKDLVNSVSSFPIFILAVVIFYLLNFSISFSVSKKLRFKTEDLISLVFVTTSRNTPLSLTLAGLLFPQFRIISIILLMGPITEIPFSLIISMVLGKLTKNERLRFFKRIIKSDLK